MNAFRCDKCKQFFLVTNEKIQYAALTTAEKKTFYLLQGEPAQVYELCKKCHKALLDWLETTE